MIKLETAKMTKAIERAKAIRPHVRKVADRTYTVTGSQANTTYTVRFAVRNGARLGECTCKAGQAHTMCYHVAAAAAVNIALHSTYHRPSETPEATYRVVGNKTAAAVVANADEVIGAGLQLDEAQRVALCAQRFEGYIAAWLEQEAAILVKPQGTNGVVVDGWLV